MILFNDFGVHPNGSRLLRVKKFQKVNRKRFSSIHYVRKCARFFVILFFLLLVQSTVDRIVFNLNKVLSILLNVNIKCNQNKCAFFANFYWHRLIIANCNPTQCEGFSFIVNTTMKVATLKFVPKKQCFLYSVVKITYFAGRNDADVQP